MQSYHFSTKIHTIHRDYMEKIITIQTFAQSEFLS